MDNQNDLAALLDLTRGRREDWLLRRMQAQDIGDLELVKQADQIIADCDEIIGDSERAYPRTPQI